MSTDPADNEPGLYDIHLKGHLDDRWAEWFDGLTLTREDNGNTRLTGLIVDQAALHGVLRKVRDLGLPLIAVIRRSRSGEPQQPDQSTDAPQSQIGIDTGPDTDEANPTFLNIGA